MPASHAFYSKMLAERTASRNVFVLFYFILFYFISLSAPKRKSTAGSKAHYRPIKTANQQVKG
jgi:hypothetical protein